MPPILDKALNGIRHLHQRIEDTDRRIQGLDAEFRKGKHPLESTLLGIEKGLEAVDKKLTSAAAPASTLQEAPKAVSCPTCERAKAMLKPVPIAETPKTGGGEGLEGGKSIFEGASSKSPSSGQVTVEEQKARTRRYLLGELVELEKHLNEQCKIAGKVCACCGKHYVSIETLAREMANWDTAARWRELRDWAGERYSVVETDEKVAQLDEATFNRLAAETRRFRNSLEK